MENKKVIAAIDLGTFNLKCAIFSFDGNGYPQLIGFSKKKTKGIHNSIIINVEDFHIDQKKFHERLADLLSRQNMPLVKMNDYVNGRGRHEQKDIASSLQVPALEKSLIKMINSFLSTELVS